jgi:uncharacterized protein YifN (PemK superfamily)
MAKAITVVVNQDADEPIIQQIAAALRANGSHAVQLRDFAETISEDQPVRGIEFQPKAGNILVCHFGLGFRKPEMVKTRPVLVISPKVRIWTKLCLVVPISSTPPDPVLPHHYQLPDGLLPGGKYDQAWIKGDMVMAVGAHRLDRIKAGFRNYVAPLVPDDVLREARRCVLHAAGMQSLTDHW